MQNSLTLLWHSVWPGSLSCCPQGQGHGPSVIQSSRRLLRGLWAVTVAVPPPSLRGFLPCPGADTPPPRLALLTSVCWKQPPAKGAASRRFISVPGIYAAPSHCSPRRVLHIISLPSRGGTAIPVFLFTAASPHCPFSTTVLEYFCTVQAYSTPITPTAELSLCITSLNYHEFGLTVVPDTFSF